jgi:hypothetical protein
MSGEKSDQRLPLLIVKVVSVFVSSTMCVVNFNILALNYHITDVATDG